MAFSVQGGRAGPPNRFVALHEEIHERGRMCRTMPLSCRAHAISRACQGPNQTDGDILHAGGLAPKLPKARTGLRKQ